MSVEGLADYQVALVRFLSAALAERRERLVGFASSPKKRTQEKIIRMFSHELESLLKAEVIVDSLPDKVWNYRAYLFPGPRNVGTAFETLYEAMTYSPDDSERLAITEDGNYGFLRTEMSGDIYVTIKRRHKRL